MKATRTKSSRSALSYKAKQKVDSLKKSDIPTTCQMNEKELFLAHSKQSMAKYISKYLTE